MNNSDHSELLRRLISTELSNIPIDSWGGFFPTLVATWRFVEATQPQLLGELCCGFDGEPYFIGTGADWFLNELCAQEAYLDEVEAIMYPLMTRVPSDSIQRGFLRPEEVPPLPGDALKRLTRVILEAAQQKQSTPA